jgi:hypothetical protein
VTRHRAWEVVAAVAVVAIILHQARERPDRNPDPPADGPPAPATITPPTSDKGPAWSPTELPGWVEVPAPAWGTAAYDAARRSDRIWVVSAEGDRVRARLREGDYGPGPGMKPGPDFDVQVKEVPELFFPTCAVRVEDGWLVGFSGGEWGGGLWWFAEDGKKNDRVARGNINGLVRSESAVFAIEGLAHGWSRGSVLRLTAKDGNWVVEEFVKLPERGLAGTAVNNDLVVVTDSKVVKVTREGKVEPLVEGLDLVGDPTSVVVAKSGTLYVGIPEFVAAINPKKPPAVKLLVPSKEFLRPEK